MSKHLAARVAVLAVVIIAGCQWSAPADVPEDAAPVDAAADAATDAAVDAPIDAGPSCDNIFGDRETQVCLRWACDRADLAEGTWVGGDTNTCTAGDNPIGRANGLKVLNLYRFLAGVPELTEWTAAPNAGQACAMAYKANGNMSPFQGGQCGLSVPFHYAVFVPFRLVRLMDLFMFDNADTSMTYRRFALSNIVSQVSMGATDTEACVLWSVPVTPVAPWVAWPPPGPVPAEALVTAGQSVDVRGWTLQSETIDLNTAMLVVSDLANLAQPLPITRNTLTGLGSAYGVRWVPNGWSTQAGHAYRVSVGNIANPFHYDIDVVSCL